MPAEQESTPTLSASDLAKPTDFPRTLSLTDQAQSCGDGETILPGGSPSQTLSLPEQALSCGDGETIPPDVSPSQTARLSASELSYPTIPGYEILGKLGEGGMGVVYRARHRKLNRVVALKMIRGETIEARHIERFQIEAEAVGRLNDPRIVQIYEVGEFQGNPYCALEFVAGGSLDKVTAQAPQDPRQAAALMVTLAQAMQLAHDKQIIHRDLKPGNVLLAGPTDAPLALRQPKISDFGLAKQLDRDSSQTREGSALGTPSYMAPEQAEGRITDLGPVTDVWALGAILYELLTGRPPFRGQSVIETMGQVIALDPVPPTRLNPSCPRDLELIALKCLNKPREKRYLSAVMLATDLERWLDGKPISVRPAGMIERSVKWAKRSPFQAATLATAVVCMFAIVAALYGQLQSVQADAELTRRELGEQKRIDDVRDRSSQLLVRAEQRAAVASEGDTSEWQAIRADTANALSLLDKEPALKEYPYRAAAQQLLLRAEGQLATAQERTAVRSKKPELHDRLSDGVFFATLYTGLELLENLQRAREATASGLALFAVTIDGEGPPKVDGRFFSPKEIQEIEDDCYELLLIDAEVLAQPLMGEKVGTWRERLREAVKRLDRADRLNPNRRTRSAVALRADCLRGLGDTATAAKLEAEAETMQPMLATDFFLLALRHHKNEETKQAIPLLTATLKLRPDHYGARFVLGICQLNEKRYTEAKDGLTLCLQQRPEFSWPRLLRGAAEIELGEDKEARDDFDAVYNAPPDSTAGYVALVNRAVLHMRRQRWDDAVKDLREAIGRKPEAIAAYVNLALTYRQKAQTPLPDAGVPGLPALTTAVVQRMPLLEAIAVLDEGIQKQPEGARLYRERARLHLLLGDGAKAREDFLKAVALAPNTNSTSTLAADLIEVGRLLQRDGDHAGAIRVYDAAIALPGAQAQALRPTTWRLKAEPLLSLRRYPEASEALDKYVASFPSLSGDAIAPETARKLSDAFKARGLIAVQTRDFRAAVDRYTEGLRVQRDAETLALRGWAYLMYQAPHLALPDFEEALKVQSNNTDARLGQADALVKLGQTKEATRAAERALTYGTPDSRAYYNAARVWAQAANARNAELQDVSRAKNLALDLLRLALDRQPEAKRKAFWKEYISADAVFTVLRRESGMQALAEKYGTP